MLNKDIQSKLAYERLVVLTTFAAGVLATNVSTAVDTEGFHAVTVALKGSRTLLPADVFTYKFQESDDGTTNWTDVVDNGHLPYRKNPERTMVEVVDPFTQTVGVFSTKRFVRLSITGTADTTAYILDPTFIKEADLAEFTGYDPAVVPGDGLP